MPALNWVTDGACFGALSDDEFFEEKSRDYLMIGPSLHEETPGKSQVLCYKSLIARRDRYASSRKPFIYSFNDQGFFEYMMVLDGGLVCQGKDSEGRSFQDLLLMFDETREHVTGLVPPGLLRSWQLPLSVYEAYAAQVLFSDHPTNVFGKGYGLDRCGFVEIWFSSQFESSTQVASIVPGMEKSYLEVFSGTVVCTVLGESRRMSRGSYVFWRKGVQVDIEAGAQDSHGVVVSYI